MPTLVAVSKPVHNRASCRGLRQTAAAEPRRVCHTGALRLMRRHILCRSGCSEPLVFLTGDTICAGGLPCRL